MIATLLRIGWINLQRDRTVQALVFVLPIAFFSIFALIFGQSSGSGGMTRVRMAIVDEDHSEASRKLIAGLEQDGSLTVVTKVRQSDEPLSRDAGLALVRDGRLPVVLVIPTGFGATFGDFIGKRVELELFQDKSNPVAGQMIAGLLQKAAFTAMPMLQMDAGLAMFERFAGPLTPHQNEIVGQWREQVRATAQPAAAANSQPAAAGDAFNMVPVRIIDALRPEKTDNTGIIAFYAAGTAVMFLLFSASGAGGALLDEQESGTLERVLSSNVGFPRLLLGKWLFITLLGSLQVVLMFVWGWAVFGLTLWTPRILTGFIVMTLVTAGAAAAFGLVLATLCRSRAQLGGISTIVILIMSAVGGSMFPRFLMGPTMQQIGLVTFNAWALDGFQKIFWYRQSVLDIGPQLGVLAGLTVVFLLLARRLGRRWETA